MNVWLVCIVNTWGKGEQILFFLWTLELLNSELWTRGWFAQNKVTRCYHKSHPTSKCMHASGFPETLCVVPLHGVCVWMFFAFLCICLRERHGKNVCERVRVWPLWVYIFRVSPLYSLTVFPSEIAGSGCVSTKYTHAHTHTQRMQNSKLTHELQIIILHSYFLVNDI